MDPFCDAFISYDNEYDPKLENLIEPNFALNSPFSQSSDSTGLFSAFLPKTIQNLLEPNEPGLQRDVNMSDNHVSKNNLHNLFQYSNVNKEESADRSDISDSIDTTESPGSSDMRDETEDKLNSKSKKISKKEKTKQNSKTKTDAETLLKNADTKFIPEGFYDPNLDEQTKKKMVQMIRNRVAAQNSRDKKKMHLNTLEDTNKCLSEENSTLIKEKAALLQRIKKLEAEKAQLVKENKALKSGNSGAIFPPPPKPEPMEEKRMDDPNPGQPANQEAAESSYGYFYNPVGPLLSRVSNQVGKLFGFGFSFAFAAVLCLFFFMNGGQMGGDSTGIANIKATNLMAMSRQLMSQLNLGEPQNIEELLQPGVMAAEGYTEGVNETVVVEEFPLLNKIKPLIDQFDSLHEKVFKVHETNDEVVVNLSNPQNLEHKTLNSILLNSKKPFLAKKKSIRAAQNKTSTFFCPGGFELFRDKKKGSVGDLIMGNSLFSNNKAFPNQLNTFGPKAHTLNLEKADYVQLFVPKNSVGRMGVAENSNEIENLPTSQKSTDNSLMEVWCKVFAVRDVAASF